MIDNKTDKKLSRLEEGLVRCEVLNDELRSQVEGLEKRIEQLEKHGLTEYEFGTSKVTKEDVDKAEAEWVTAYDDAKAINAAYEAAKAAAAYAAANKVWDKYIKLKREYQNA